MNTGSIVISISSRVVDSIYGNSQAPIRSYVMKRAEAFEQESLLPKLFRMENSRHWAEQYGGETAMENFVPVGEGGSYPLTGFEEGFQKTLVNETWKQSFAITRELVDDAQLGKMKQRANKLMTSYYRTREMFGRSLYAGGLLGTEVQIGGKKFSTASADGKKLFATNHIAKVKGNQQSNAFAGEFTAANLDAVETMMQNVSLIPEYRYLRVLPQKSAHLPEKSRAFRSAVFLPYLTELSEYLRQAGIWHFRKFGLHGKYHSGALLLHLKSARKNPS